MREGKAARCMAGLKVKIDQCEEVKVSFWEPGRNTMGAGKSLAFRHAGGILTKGRQESYAGKSQIPLHEMG